MMFFREAPEWIQQVLRDLSREGYIYIGRTGVGLSYAFRKAPMGRASVCSDHSPIQVLGALPECYNQGTIKAIEKHAGDHDLGYRILLELIATEGPKWVGYERIAEYIESQALLRALKEELT